MDRKWWTLIAVCAGTFMLLLDVTIVIVAQPAIQRHLNATFSDVQWTLDAYALTLASLLLTSGVLADRYGRRLLFSIGLAVFSLGSLLCGLATSPLMLIISRCGQGVGGAIVFATSLALLGHSFRGRERGIAFGVWGAVVGVSTALGPVLGGVITTDWSWRGIFLVNVPIGALALIATLWRVEESRSPEPTRPDWIGFILLTLGLVSFIYGLIRAGEESWSDTRAIACLAGGAVLIAAFVVAEAFVRHPMFDLALLRVPTFTGGSIAAFAMNGSLFAVLLYYVIYLQDVLGYSALGAGLRLAVISLAQLVTAIIGGRLSSIVPARWLVGPGLFVVGIGLVLTGQITGDSTWTRLIPGFIVSGLGSGLVNPPLASTAIGVVPPDKAGMASGVNSTFRQVGIATGIAALGTLFTARMHDRLSATLPSSLSGLATPIVNAVRQGSAGHVIGSLPGAERAVVGDALRSSFAAGLNELTYVTAGLAFVGAVCATLLIRPKDFYPAGAGKPSAPAAIEAPPVVEAPPVSDIPTVADTPIVSDTPTVAAASPVSDTPTVVDTPPVVELPATVEAPPRADVPAAVTVPTADGTGDLAVFGLTRHDGGSPLSGATITLIDATGKQAGIAHSDPDGRYRVPVPAPGAYTLIAMAGSHEPHAATLHVGDEPAEADILLSSAASLSGVVRAAGTGKALPGVTVTLTDGRGEVIGTCATGEDGAYFLEDLAAGEYTLTVSARSYQPLALQAVIGDGQPTTLDPELRSGARVRGTARTRDGGVVPDARVTLLDLDGNVAGVATTGPDGVYSFENLPEGEYTVIATGYPPAASDLKITDSERHSHDIHLGHPEA